MRYEELIKKVQKYSGLSNDESRQALQMMVESLAVRLNDSERQAFASTLPEQLQDIAMAVYPSAENASGDILHQFMLLENINERRAQKQIQAAWRTLKDSMPGGKLQRVERQLPVDTSYQLR